MFQAATWRGPRPAASSLRPWTGLSPDEPETGVAYAPPAGLAAGDDGCVEPELGDGAEDGAPVAVEGCDDAPARNSSTGKRGSISCLAIVVGSVLLSRG